MWGFIGCVNDIKRRFRNCCMRPTSSFIHQFLSALANYPFVSSWCESVCSPTVYHSKSYVSGVFLLLLLLCFFFLPIFDVCLYYQQVVFWSAMTLSPKKVFIQCFNASNSKKHAGSFLKCSFVLILPIFIYLLNVSYNIR